MEEATIKYFFALCSLSALVACDEKSKFSETKYAETEAEIICAGEYDGAYITAIQYNSPQSTAINVNGSPIKGPIQSSWLEKNKPIDHQKIRIRYLKEEPIIFEKIDKIKFEQSDKK